MRPEHWIYTVPLRLRSLLRRPQVDRDLDEEIRDHLERRIADYIEQGMPAEEARDRAYREFGGIEQSKENCRDTRKVNWLYDVVRDARQTVRQLRQNPGFAALAILTLAFGIGANTAVFNVLNGVLLRPLPYHDPSRLAGVFMIDPARPADRGPFSPQDLEDFRRQQQAYSNVGAFWYSPASSGKTLTGASEPQHLETAFVDSGFFATLDVAPVLGRTFVAAEDVHGNDQVAVLSDSLWRRQFGADPQIVGRAVSLDGAPFVVVGVMPPSFVFPAPQVDLWLPLAQITDQEIPHLRQLRWIDVVARLKPAVSIQQAASASTVVMERLRQLYPQSNKSVGAAAVVNLRQTIVGDVQPILWPLFAAVALVLLLACVNLVNLLLARGTARRREFAIRSALGGGRGRLRRQALTETLVLAVMGGLASFLLAKGMSAALLALSGNSIPRAAGILMDEPVILFGVVLSLVTGVLIGLIPATIISAERVGDALKSSAAATTASVRHERGREALIVSEIALACVLLAASSLVLKSLWKLVNVNPGFNPQHVLSVELPLPLYKFSDPMTPKLNAYRDELLRRVAAVPGVTAVGGSKTLPLYGGGEPYDFKAVNSRGQTQRVMPSAGTFIVTQGYFEALAIPLVAGRFFTAADLAQNRPVAIVNRSLAEMYWPGENAVGRDLGIGPGKMEVIGVVGDVRNEGLNKASGTAIYVPASLFSRAKLDLFVRTSGDPLSVAGTVRQAIRSYDPDQAITNIEPLDHQVYLTLAQPRFFTIVLSAFGAMALLLAALGVFGVISYNVRQRTHEIGIRMALGASRGGVLGMVVRRAALLLALGATLGVIGSLICGRLLSGLLYNVKVADPLALLASVAVLGAVALTAATIPAVRAARIEPMVALRDE
jgi:putative ABC transport system permease protein